MSDRARGEAEWTAWKAKLTRGVMALARITGPHWKGEVMLREIRIKPEHKGGSDTMVIVKGTYEGQPVVAFHTAMTAEAAFSEAMLRFEQNSLKWHEDKPWDGS